MKADIEHLLNPFISGLLYNYLNKLLYIRRNIGKQLQ